jgi:5-methylcytosine-specific restriction protein B
MDPSTDPATLQDFLADSFLAPEAIRPILKALEVKKNVILQGPPGTGKTFIAKRLAYAMMGERDTSRIEMVQFHQSYSYEDFIQGYRPVDGGQFDRQDGVFHRFCSRARADDRPHFFIIDEINRGNLSKIFGELMMLIEADKRGEELQLTYSRAGEPRFSIPSNVHLIGTMNTADRSLAVVDYALRRRFAFFRLGPSFNEKFQVRLEADGCPPEWTALICARLNALNLTIREDLDLGEGFEIGHSYFVGEARWSGGEPAESYRAIVDQEIAPMLAEYWFENREKASAEAEMLSKDLPS